MTDLSIPEFASKPARLMAEIIIIEDDELLRQMLVRWLGANGYPVREAGNGHEGLRLMREHPAALVITDLVMPDMEGIETIRHLRRDYPKTKIVAISGGGVGDANGYLKIASELGAHRTFAKPFFPGELLSAVEELLPVRPASPPSP